MGKVRLDPGPSVDLLYFERQAYASGFRCVAGIDEAGRGPLAGPVVAACVVLSLDRLPDDINDSKALSPARRDRAYDQIVLHATAYGIGIVDSQTIDRINILQATLLAMRTAHANLNSPVRPNLVLIDGNTYPRIGEVEERTIVKGDSLSASIAAASILAKVIRDRIMVEAHTIYPKYGFMDHKGYSTPSHLSALSEHGPCPLHRRSFSPVSQLKLEFHS